LINHEVNHLRKFAAIALFALLALTACAHQSRYTFADIPAEGDPAHGAVLFNQGKDSAPACSTCHEITAQTTIGPGLAGIGERAGTRVSGQSAKEYIFNSITNPPLVLVTGFSNLMYDQYEAKLTPQDIADLTAYLLQL
jgi:cytochrome c553